MTEQTAASTTGTWSYRPGSWFGVFGAATTLLLPASEKGRVGELWSQVDDGAGFDDVLEALLTSGLGVLPGFVLVGNGEGPTKVLVRGASVRATVTTPTGDVELDGSTVTTWVERTLPDVTALTVTVDGGDPDAGDLPIHGGLVRVGRVDHPPHVEPAPESVADPAPVAGAAPVTPAVVGLDDDVSAVPAEPLAVVADPEPLDAEPVDAEPVDAEPVEPVEPAEVEPTDEQPAVPAPSFLDKPVDPWAPAPVAAATEVPGEPEAPEAVDPTDDEDAVATELLEVADPSAGPAGDPLGSPPPPPPGLPPIPAPPVLPPTPPAWPGGATPPPPPSFAPADAPTVPPPADPPSPFGLPDVPADASGGAEGADGTDDPTDHDGLTRIGVDADEFARPLPGIPGQPMAPGVGRSVAKLVLSHGETVEVDRVILIGRAPEARRFTTTDQPRLVTVPSPLHEISSTHVEIRPGSGADHGSAVVTDMGSTNGTVLVQPGLAPEELKPGIAVQLIPGATVNLGDGITIQVTHP